MRTDIRRSNSDAPDRQTDRHTHTHTLTQHQGTLLVVLLILLVLLQHPFIFFSSFNQGKCVLNAASQCFMKLPSIDFLNNTYGHKNKYSECQGGEKKNMAHFALFFSFHFLLLLLLLFFSSSSSSDDNQT